MKNLLQFLSIIILSFWATSSVGQTKDEVSGTYKLKNGNKIYQALSDKNYEKIVLNEDNTYLLYHAQANFSPVIEQCDLASKGKWTKISNDVIDLVSEDYIIKQDGFKYELKQENKLSQDSIYFDVEFPNDYHPVTMTFNFNYGEWYTTDKLHISLPKNKYLRSDPSIENSINLTLDAIVSGSKIYKSRIMFKIFNETFDTHKNNYFTIKLPYFDQCFFEFEPYDHSFMYIKDKNTLQWQGEEWIKVK
ncbi:hypothetical protein [Chryseobacterium sp. GP-SGM7]|uniref:hypothetical protein n=1 Tax=Chryseobacterium sp. GP-SGM7 TaxID=3411323 RepID=UPI003B93FD54